MSDNQQRAARLYDRARRSPMALEVAATRDIAAALDEAEARGRVEALREAATAWARHDGLTYEDWQAHEFLRDRADGLEGR